MEELNRRFDLQLFAEEKTGEKTEEATPRRREETKRKGQVSRSTELNGAVALLAMVFVLSYGRESYIRRVMGLLYNGLGGAAATLTQGNLLGLIYSNVIGFLYLIVPLMLVAMVAGIVTNLAQTGFLFVPGQIRPRGENINPFEGAKRIFSRRALVELLKGLLRVVLIAVAAYALVRSSFYELMSTAEMELAGGGALIADTIFRLALLAGVILFAVATLDFIYQRREFNQRLRMTKQEIKEEMKQTEGDPLIRGKLRERQRQLATRRMMQEVPKATVVVTNPTHVAVALRYEEGRDSAPRVVAKGAELVAKRIRQIAEENGVPVVENPPVARFLYEHTGLMAEVPADMYQAVAEILALIYGKKRPYRGG